MHLSRLPIILGFLFLLLTIPFAVLLLSQRQQTEVTAGVNRIALVYVWPREFSLPLEAAATVEVMIETKGQPSRRAEATLSFDPNFFKINEKDVVAATGVNLSQKVIDASRGIIQLAGVGEFERQKTLARINLNAGKRGTTQIEISKAHVWDPTGTVDLLRDTQGAQLTIE